MKDSASGKIAAHLNTNGSCFVRAARDGLRPQTPTRHSRQKNSHQPNNGSPRVACGFITSDMMLGGPFVASVDKAERLVGWFLNANHHGYEPGHVAVFRCSLSPDKSSVDTEILNAGFSVTQSHHSTIQKALSPALRCNRPLSKARKPDFIVSKSRFVASLIPEDKQNARGMRSETPQLAGCS